MRVTRWLGALAVLGLLAAACSNTGGDDDGGAGEQSTPEVGSGEATTEAAIIASADRDTFVELDVPGVTDDEISFTSISTISGNPLGTNLGPAYNEGIQAYFDFRNDQGGIYGRDLALANERDDELGFNDREAQAAVSEDDVFGIFVATLLPTGFDILGDSGIPVFGWNIWQEFGGKENLFGHIGPSCQARGCTGKAVPYMAREVGASTIGILGYGTTENSLICAENIRDSVELYGDDVGGLEVGFFDNTLEFGLPNGLAPQVSAMKDAGVDFITSCMDLNAMQTLGDELAQQELDVTMHHPNSYNADFVAANAEIFEGDLVIPQFTAFEADFESELLETYFEYIDPETAPEELAMTGFLNAHLAFLGLLAAGPEFDQATTIAAIRSIEDYTADGMSNAIDWGRQIPAPTGDNPEVEYELECFNAVEVVDGEFVQWTGEPGSPWTCWELDRSAWSEPEARSFSL